MNTGQLKKEALYGVSLVQDYFNTKYEGDIPRFIENYISELEKEIKRNKE